MVEVQKKEIKQTEVNLKMDEEEAKTLVGILHKVGGHPQRTRRKHVDAMIVPLENAGIIPHPNFTNELKVEHGGLHFRDDGDPLIKYL